MNKFYNLLGKYHSFQPLVTKSSFIGMCYMMGFLVGSLVFGLISDKYGRKIALLTSVVLSGAFSFIGNIETRHTQNGYTIYSGFLRVLLAGWVERSE